MDTAIVNLIISIMDMDLTDEEFRSAVFDVLIENRKI